MVQTYKEDCFGYSHIASADMTSIENNFACLRSMFSGVTAPPSPSSGYVWFCTTKKHLRIRNGSNNAWYGVLTTDGPNGVILVYRNDTDDGFAIWGNSEDFIVGIKSASGTYTVGGASAGSWSIYGHAALTSHNHNIYHSHSVSGGAHNHYLTGAGWRGGLSSDPDYNTKDRFTETDGAHNHTIAGTLFSVDFVAPTIVGSSWRPAAVVCSMQYLTYWN